MTTTPTVDLDDTSRCPATGPCEGCGATDREVAPRTADALGGVICVRLCGPCVDAGRMPRFGCVDAATRGLEHCEHLGIDLDEMAAIIERGE